MTRVSARLAKLEFLGNARDKIKAAVVTVEVEISHPGSPLSDVVTMVTDISAAPADTLQQIFDRAAEKAAHAFKTASAYSDAELAARMASARSYELS